jgi:metal-dependent HD superfamily phosphatase/phosphodiesterase
MRVVIWLMARTVRRITPVEAKAVDQAIDQPLVVPTQPTGETAAEVSLAVVGLARGKRLKIHVPARYNLPLQRVVAAVNSDCRLYQLWCCANVTAVQRLGMSDHGPVHVQIVANVALKLLRMIASAGGVPGLVRDYGLTEKDAEVVVVLGALLHDVGMSIHRSDHELYSLIVAEPQLGRLLGPAYGEPERTVIVSETLHAIIAHRAGGRPLTLEAGIVRVADALDLAHGRSRIPYQAGQINIHSVSAAAIERVEILPGEAKAVRISITMANSAGIYQIDELLRDKLQGSGLEPYVEVEARIEGKTEKRLINVVRF